MPRPTHVVRLAIASGLVALATGGLPPAAHAEPARGQLTYTCQTAGEGYEDQATPYPFVTALQLDVPEQVSPGDVLTLSGTLSVQMPEELRSLAEDYFTYAQAVSDSMTVPVTVGGRTTILQASRFDSGRVATRNQPLILRSVVSAAPFTVPDDARGEVVVELPSNGSVPSNIDRSKVAFAAEALLSGGFVATFVPEYVYKVSCTAPPNAERTVARIPIADAVTTPSTTSGALPDPAPSAAAVLPEAPGAAPPVGDPTSVPASPRASSAPGAAPTAEAGGTPVAPPTTVTVAAPDDGSIRVPGWLLLVCATLVLLAALSLAAWSQHRVRVFRASMEG